MSSCQDLVTAQKQNQKFQKYTSEEPEIVLMTIKWSCRNLFGESNQGMEKYLGTPAVPHVLLKTKEH